MIDVNIIRKDPNIVKENLRKRNREELLSLVDEFLEVDKIWREKLTNLNKLRKEHNKLNVEVAKAKKENKSIESYLEKIKILKQEMQKLETDLEYLEKRRREILLQIPNLLDNSVPYGKDENDNVEIRRYGKPPEFNFEPKTHLEILKDLDMIDFERGAKVAGNQFYYLKGKAVLLDFALQRFAIDELMKKGFKLVEPPFMVNKRSYEGMIGNPFDFSEASYKIEDEELYLIPTAEYSLGAQFQDYVFLEEELPLKLVGISPCFRKEAGTHGKYAKGLFRVHHFNKVEQFIFSKPEESWEWLEKLQKNSEELYQKLELHYRVIVLCSGDTSSKSAKTYDIEVWMADGKFREVGSNSNCTDFQARRLNIRYREKEGMPVKGYVHTLNNTALATSRTMIAIIEQNQEEDGSVKIPKVLWKYCGFKKLEKE